MRKNKKFSLKEKYKKIKILILGKLYKKIFFFFVNKFFIVLLIALNKIDILNTLIEYMILDNNLNV